MLIPYLDEAATLSDSVSWAELLAEPAELQFEPVPADHPLWILYSSGTTGLPKAIVHGHGGMLVEHLKAVALHMDVGRGDRFFWFTTTGWMMWNFLVGGLLVGSTIVLFDGSPAYPDLGALWRLAEKHRVSCFGTSAPFLLSCLKGGLRPGEEADLSAPFARSGRRERPCRRRAFVTSYEAIGPDVLLASISGGTDVCTAFVGGVPILPVYEGEIQCRLLGAKVEAFDPAGRSLVDEVGELVVTEPLPCMPVRLLERPRRQPAARGILRGLPGCLAAR